MAVSKDDALKFDDDAVNAMEGRIDRIIKTTLPEKFEPFGLDESEANAKEIERRYIAAKWRTGLKLETVNDPDMYGESARIGKKIWFLILS